MTDKDKKDVLNQQIAAQKQQIVYCQEAIVDFINGIERAEKELKGLNKLKHGDRIEEFGRVERVVFMTCNPDEVKIHYPHLCPGDTHELRWAQREVDRGAWKVVGNVFDI